MKIAFIGQKGIPAKQGGVEKHVEGLSVRLAKASFGVYVYSRPSYTGKKIKKYRGVNIINLPSINTKHLDAISHTFIATIHALFQNYDIIHYHGVGPALLSFIPRIFRPDVKVIATFHCVDRQHQKWGAFAKWILGLGEVAACSFPHETIAVSRTIKEYCKFRFDKNAIYIPNGVAISQEKKQSRIFKKYGLKKGGYILTVSRLVRHKGIHTLIKAYQKIKTDKKLAIVGGGAKTDSYVGYLKQLADGDKNIVFTGEQTGADLSALFKNACLFVQPSEAEGLSIALLEAMAYGLPILASDIAENHEVVEDCGLEFKNKNAEDLARRLKFALSHGQELEKLAVLAKTKVRQDYDWKNIAKQTKELYNQTANQEKLAGRKINMYSLAK